MKAIRPDSPRRGSFTKRGALSVAAATMLLLVAGFSVMTTGCSDDDDDAPCCAGGRNDASGLGGQTYSVNTFVGETRAQLVIVTRGGGATSPASTAGMLQAGVEAGPADGVLVFQNGLREILAGSYDPDVVEEDAPTLTVGSVGGVSFEGDATSTDFIGTLTVEDIDEIRDLSGPGGQEDAPLIHLLGTWEHKTEIVANCGTLGMQEIQCEGFTRVRNVGRHQRMDTYESCGSGLSECLLARGPSLADGMWSGLNYFENTSFTRSYENCPVEVAGDLNLSVNSETLSSVTNGTVTFRSSACLPINTECTIEQTMSATRCVDCWPSSCTDGL